MAPAGYQHGRIAQNIAASLDRLVRDDGAGVILDAETGFKLSANPDTVRASDVAFATRERAEAAGEEAGYWPGAPDLAVEVVSPNDRFADTALRKGSLNPFRRGDHRRWRGRLGLDAPRCRCVRLTLAALPGSPGRPLLPAVVRGLRRAGERPPVPPVLRVVAVGGESDLRTLRPSNSVQDPSVRRVQERGLRFCDGPGALALRRGGKRDRARPQVPWLHGRRREARRPAVSGGGRRTGRIRRRRAGAAAQGKAQKARLQPGRAARPRSGGPDKLTRFGYTTSRAEHPGSGRAVGRGETPERGRRVLGRGSRAGQAPSRRRRLHHRCHHERLRRGAARGRRRRSPRRDAV